MIRQRHINSQIIKHIPDKRHTIITGARQVGKTSVLKWLFQKLSQESNQVWYLTFEDHRILDSVNSHPVKIFDHIPVTPPLSMQQTLEQPIFLLIDEVQYAQDPTHFLKYIYDQYEGNVKIIATGSSAFYIDRNFTDSLAGRKRIFNLSSLSLEEYIEFHDRPDLMAEISALREKPDYISPQQNTIRKFFFEYLTFGGYPAVALEKDFNEKKFLLEELKNAYVKRDIYEADIKMENRFFLLFQLLADQTGELINKNELASTVQIDHGTIDYYLYTLEKCYHIHRVKPFFRNLRKELTKMPKLYFNDLGMRNILLNRFDGPELRSDKGQLLENYFFLRLKQKYDPDQIRFWRTTDQKEVDFVVEEQFGEGKAIEIKWLEKSFDPKKYNKFTETYPFFDLSCLDSTQFLFR
ncbi:MAG: AAA family ATPase [Bacteroidia bacterium]|nr:AAA family ATPase [Bacteroidia bacterium]